MASQDTPILTGRPVPEPLGPEAADPGFRPASPIPEMDPGIGPLAVFTQMHHQGVKTPWIWENNQWVPCVTFIQGLPNTSSYVFWGSFDPEASPMVAVELREQLVMYLAYSFSRTIPDLIYKHNNRGIPRFSYFPSSDINPLPTDCPSVPATVMIEKECLMHRTLFLPIPIWPRFVSEPFHDGDALWGKGDVPYFHPLRTVLKGGLITEAEAQTRQFEYFSAPERSPTPSEKSVYPMTERSENSVYSRDLPSEVESSESLFTGQPPTSASNSNTNINGRDGLSGQQNGNSTGGPSSSTINPNATTYSQVVAAARKFAKRDRSKSVVKPKPQETEQKPTSTSARKAHSSSSKVDKPKENVPKEDVTDTQRDADSDGFVPVRKGATPRNLTMAEMSVQYGYTPLAVPTLPKPDPIPQSSSMHFDDPEQELKASQPEQVQWNDQEALVDKKKEDAEQLEKEVQRQETIDKHYEITLLRVQLYTDYQVAARQEFKRTGTVPNDWSELEDKLNNHASTINRKYLDTKKNACLQFLEERARVHYSKNKDLDMMVLRALKNIADDTVIQDWSFLEEEYWKSMTEFKTAEKNYLDTVKARGCIPNNQLELPESDDLNVYQRCRVGFKKYVGRQKLIRALPVEHDTSPKYSKYEKLLVGEWRKYPGWEPTQETRAYKKRIFTEFYRGFVRDSVEHREEDLGPYMEMLSKALKFLSEVQSPVIDFDAVALEMLLGEGPEKIDLSDYLFAVFPLLRYLV